MDSINFRIEPWIIPIHGVIDKDAKRRRDEEDAAARAAAEAKQNQGRLF